MKYYVDYNNGQIKIDVEKEFYQSENLENKITVLLTNVADPEDEVVPTYFLSIEFLRSDGRKCTIQTADAFGEEEDTTLTEDYITYDIHNFTLTEQVLKCAGTLMFTVYINFVNSDTGKVIRRGVLLNGLNNVKKTVAYSTNAMLVIDDESEAEDTVENILDELTSINAVLATKQKNLVFTGDSGLTMVDGYKPKVKGNPASGITVGTTGVKLNYDTDEFQVIDAPLYDNKPLKLNYFYNTIPVNKYTLTDAQFRNNLTVTSVDSYSGSAKTYTYTFSGLTAKLIFKNYNHMYKIMGTYAYDNNFTNAYALSLDASSDAVCRQLLNHLARIAVPSEENLITGGSYLFVPVYVFSNRIFFTCSNFVFGTHKLSVTLDLTYSNNVFTTQLTAVNSGGKMAVTDNSYNNAINLSNAINDIKISSAEYGDGQGKKVSFIDENTNFYGSPRYLDFGIDYAPTEDSENLVFSGGVKTAIDNLEVALNADIEASGHTIELALDSTNFKITAMLKDANGNTISTSTAIDLPLESVVVSGAYDDATQKVVLTLQNGSTIEFSVADLVSGLQAEITSANKLDADLVDDTNSTNKFVTASEKSQITTNATAISNIKDGTNLDSFGDVESALGNKVDKITGKGLSTNDFTDTLKVKLDNSYGPAYTGKDTSTNILAFTTNKGIYVGSDTGHWYYWNGTQYVDGGSYLTSNIVTGRTGFILVGSLNIDTTNLTITSNNIQYNTNDVSSNIVLNNQSVSYLSNSHPQFIYFNRYNNIIEVYDSVTQSSDISSVQNNQYCYLIAILYNGNLTFTLSSEYIYIDNVLYTTKQFDTNAKLNDIVKTATHYPFVKYSLASNGIYQKAITNIVFTKYTTTNLSLHAIYRNATVGTNTIYSVVLWNNDTNSQLGILNVLASGYTEKVRNEFNNVGGFSGYFDIDWSVIPNGTVKDLISDRPKILPICFKDIEMVYEEFAIPSTIPVVVNREIRLEYYNMFKCDNIDDYVVIQNTNDSVFENLGTSFKIKTTTVGNTSKTIFMKKDDNTILAKTITIKSVDDNTKPSIKAIFIGDSFTDVGYYLAELKTLMGENLTLYGTLTSIGVNSNDESITVNDEGRAGWGAYDYCNTSSKNGYTNPFLNNSTFDFNYYITNNSSFSDVTDVFILLGTNDGNRNDFITNIQTMCNSIKSYNNNIKIHLMLPTPPIKNGYAWGVRNHTNVLTFKNYMFTHAKNIISRFGGVSGYSVIATNLNIDCWYDFPKTEVQANMRNPELIEVGNDNVHPNRYGYYRIADMIYADIIANS